jgi:hypothetical protein
MGITSFLYFCTSRPEGRFPPYAEELATLKGSSLNGFIPNRLFNLPLALSVA